jgi:SAM-dependent methyltransferase
MTEFVYALKTSLWKPARGFLKRLYLGIFDFADAASRRKDMMPPRNMRLIGDGDFRAIGLAFRRLFTDYGGLKPDDRVLDVGCGIGRMAVPLAGYLSANGEYQGFDVVRKGVEWCQENITPRYPKFHFHHADIHNKDYNPHGAIQASGYEFPYDDGYFDFVLLTSVFTHMLPPDLENYLYEISRVLRRGGTCFITFFLLNEESAGLIRRKLSKQNFIHEVGGCFTTTLENPEAAVAFLEPYIRGLFARSGLTICEPIHFGSWCGRARFLSYQDIVIGRKS